MHDGKSVEVSGAWDELQLGLGLHLIEYATAATDKRAPAAGCSKTRGTIESVHGRAAGGPAARVGCAQRGRPSRDEEARLAREGGEESVMNDGPTGSDGRWLLMGRT